MKSLSPSKEQVSRQYKSIRKANPEPSGDHWEGFGAYLGDGVWADPDMVGRKGDFERMPIQPNTKGY